MGVAKRWCGREKQNGQQRQFSSSWPKLPYAVEKFSKIINKFKLVVDRGQDFSRAGDAQFCWGWGRVCPMKFDIGRGFVYMGIAGSGPGQ